VRRASEIVKAWAEKHHIPGKHVEPDVWDYIELTEMAIAEGLASAKECIVPDGNPMQAIDRIDCLLRMVQPR
jgi:hypothetical protein